MFDPLVPPLSPVGQARLAGRRVAQRRVVGARAELQLLQRHLLGDGGVVLLESGGQK